MTWFNKIKAKKTAISAFYILCLFFIAFFFSLTTRAQPLVVQPSSTDSSVFQYVARVILEGGVPYRDTFDHKGPFLYFLNVLALWLSPRYGLWIVEFITLFVTFGLMYKISCLYSKKVTSVFVVLTIACILNGYFEGGNFTEEYALPFIAGALYIFSAYFKNEKVTRLRLFLCGVCLGAVLLLRVNMIAVWVVMSMGVLLQCIIQCDYKRILFFLIYFVAGLLAFITPFIIWLALRGGLIDFWNDYFLFNFLYTSNSQDANTAAKIKTFFVFANDTWVLFATFVIVLSYFRKKDYLNSLYFLSLVVSLAFICLSGKSFSHYGMVLTPILVVPLAYIGNAVDDCWNKNNLSGVFIITWLFITMVTPTWSAILNNVFYSYQNRGTCSINSSLLSITSWVEENTSPDEQIIVCGNENNIYNLSNRFAASRYSYQSPICRIDSTKEKEFFEEISRNKPAVILLPDDFYAYEKMIEFIEVNGYAYVYTDQAEDAFSLYRLP